MKPWETLNDQIELINNRMQRTADTATTAMGEISRSSIIFEQLARKMDESFIGLSDNIKDSFGRVSIALDSLEQRLAQNQQFLVKMQEQFRITSEESAKAQGASIDVLKQMTEVTRGINTARDGKKHVQER